MLHIEEVEYAPGLRQIRHAHSEHTVSLVLSGGLRERVGSQEEIAGPLSIVVKPCDTEHQDEFGPKPTRLFRITLGPALARECHCVATHLTSWRWHTASQATPAFLRLLRQARKSTEAGEPELQDAALDVLSAIAIEHRPPPAGTPPRWLLLVRERLQDTGRPSVSELARQADVHPVYLARQFRRWYGSSIREYLRSQRVQHAAGVLAARRGTISAASYDAGFSDQAHLCRMFKGTTGLTPAAFRSLLAGQV